MGTRVIIGSTTLISFILAGMLFYQQSTRETLKGLGWELVADQGTVKFVYVNPIRCADEQFMAGVLFEILGDPYENDLPLVEIYFFDDLEYTPTGLPISREKLEENEFPFSDSQLRHFRAVYTFNQSDGDNFCFVDFTNSYATPPEFTLRRADISPIN
jgi:hypothetical protein